MVKSFRDIHSREDVVAWMNHVNGKWPERAEVMRHISDQSRTLSFSRPQVVELGSGPGQLAERLLADLPHITYTGIDSSALLLDYARDQLAPYGRRVGLIYADLNKDGWQAQLLSRVQAIVSMQSLHDLGGEAEIDRIYGLAKDLLVPGGLFLNADLVLPAPNPGKPGRLTIAHHLELLRAHGYRDPACTLEAGELACFAAFSA